MVEIGQQCDHPLVAVGRHRVCRDCAAVYAAVAGPNEVTLLGGYTAVLALLDECDAALAAQGEAQRLRAALRGLANGGSDEPDWLRCWCPESWMGGRQHAPECLDARNALAAQETGEGGR